MIEFRKERFRMGSKIFRGKVIWEENDLGRIKGFIEEGFRKLSKKDRIHKEKDIARKTFRQETILEI